MGLLAVLVAAPLQMTNQLSKTSMERLVESAETPGTLRMFAKHFSGAQIARSPLISCEGNSKVFKTTSIRRDDGLISLKPKTEDDTTPDEARRFSLPFASATSVAAIDDSSSDGVSVVDPGPFNVGDLVVMVNAENSSIAGMFEIRDKATDEPKVFLRDASDVRSGDCELVPGENTTLASFKTMASTKGLRNVILLRFHIATYQIVKDSVFVHVYPQTPEGEFTSTFVDKFEDMKLAIQYQERRDAGAALDADDFNEVEGTVWATIELTMLEPDIASANRQKRCNPQDFTNNKSQVCQDGQVYYRRRIANSLRFVLSGLKTLNGQVVTRVVSKQNLFPTCYIKAQEEGFKLKLPDKLMAHVDASSKMYRISGAVSEPGLSQVNLGITAILAGASKINCINAGELKALKDPRNPTKPEDIPEYSDKFVLRGTAAQLDEMLCAVRGSVQLEGILDYFDPGTMRSQRIRCNDQVGKLGGLSSEYEITPLGERVRCKQSGQCHLPQELTDLTTNEVVLGSFHQDINCEWSDGQIRECCDGKLPTDPLLRLRKVELVVSNLKIKDPSKLSAVCN